MNDVMTTMKMGVKHRFQILLNKFSALRFDSNVLMRQSNHLIINWGHW